MRLDNLAIKDADEFCFSSFATPPSGGELCNEIQRLLDYPDKSVTEQQHKQVAEKLSEVFKESSTEDWDGYGAKPVSIRAFFEALKLLELLPSSLPLPDILAEPSGEIGFEWYKNSKYTFVISIAGDNLLTYAGIFGEYNKIHGTEFFGDRLPIIIIKLIQRTNKGT